MNTDNTVCMDSFFIQYIFNNKLLLFLNVNCLGFFSYSYEGLQNIGRHAVVKCMILWGTDSFVCLIV